ncbi:MAG: hemolysin [Brevundimonas sp.]|uniref:hemolysin n=1 Tax=Brevundimonas sp. TaxID=1871086 RepID=UPI0040342ED8
MSMILRSSLIAAAAMAALAACAPVETAEAPMPGATGPKVCRAENYQRFIGKPRAELPTMPADESWRVLCSTCAATMDYREDRLTIVFDTNSQLIQSARCG